MEFRVLGPLEVVDRGHAIALGAAKQRALLAILLLNANEVVSSDRLIDELWGERPPATARKLIHGYISQLRALLEPFPTRREDRVLLTRPPGYALHVDPEQLDLSRFERLVTDASRVAATDPALAAGTLREALGLWRGPPLAEFAAEPFAHTAIGRLEELRMVALGERIAADLALGRHRELVGELEALVAAAPLREGLRAELMLALYRSGRQAEALQAYRDVRALLVEELGIEPGRELQLLERAILRQDAELEPPQAAAAAPPAELVVAPPPPPAVPARQIRKNVTVLVVDPVGSTRAGPRLDPEAFGRVMARYCEEMCGVLKRHGGTFEQLAGDGLVAVFGIPVLHEDDALRAVRAAAEMRAALSVLNEELRRVWGVELALRVGANSGEVVATDPSSGEFAVTGEVVRVARRLQERAEPDEILISDATHRLVRDAVRVEPVAPLRSTGWEEPIAALRLLDVRAELAGRVRRFQSPLVGRSRQLAALLGAVTDTVADRTCRLFTVLGPAGVGKSRLVEECVAGLGDGITVLRGRCLPYGDGITYWPVAEVVQEALGASGHGTAEERLAAIAAHVADEPKADLIVEGVAQAIGIGGVKGGTGEETFWALRKLLEALARRQPLVLVFDDLHWAEPTFLDLVESLADFSRDAPILLLCIARPELLEGRPGWSGGKLNAISILLEPLSDGDCRQLITNLLGQTPLRADVESRIAAAAEGNPLFAEELLASLLESDLLRLEDGRWTASKDLADLPVPATIHALLAARLEQLPDDERIVLERAAVEGSLFHRGALDDLLSGSRDGVAERCLAALVRKDLVRPATPSFRGEDAFRFRHVLIRDAAYRSLPKEARADLHERLATWLEQRAGGRLGEFEEIVGYHLEQAYRYRADLRVLGPEANALGEKAAERLGSAGSRALARCDLPAAIGLLERAAALLPVSAPRRARLLADLGATLIEAGRLAEAERVLSEASAAASAAADEWADSRALVERQFLELQRAVVGATDEAPRIVRRVIPVLERAGDQRGLCRARRLQAWSEWIEARAAAAAAAWERAAVHARRAGEEHERAASLTWVASSIWFGPVPVEEGIRRCEELRGKVSGHLASEAEVLRPLGGLHGMAGRFDLARSFFAASNAVFADLGLTLNSVHSHPEAVVEMLAGNFAVAEHCLRSGYEILEAMGEKNVRSTTAAFLARAIFAQGRYAEAERFTELSEELGDSRDLLTQILWRGVRARLLAARARFDDGERLVREAVTLAERTDLVNFHADALIDLAAVLEAAGDAGEASAAVARAIRLYEQKGNAVAATAARARLDDHALV